MVDVNSDQQPSYSTKELLRLFGFGRIRRVIGLRSAPFSKDDLVERLKRFYPKRSTSELEAEASRLLVEHIDEKIDDGALSWISLTGPIDYFKLEEAKEKDKYQLWPYAYDVF
ncbi:hypothetical protein KY349_01975 [Candidatus Woesearchaeota archaeon]|nr:hypothetical protein [Candidatus Woesearchaeota archaeon]